MSAPGLVDGHAHVFASADREQRPVDALAPAERSAAIEDLWGVAETAGVRAAVLVPLGTDDATAAAALDAHRGRCAGVAVAGPAELGDGGPERLRERRAGYPFDAVRLTWLGEPGRALDESPAWPLLRALADQDLVLWSYLGPEQAGHLPELTRRLPTLRIVLNHLGFAPSGMAVDEHRRPRFPGALDPSAVERVLRLADHPTTYLMVSGHYALSETDPPYPDLVEPTRRLARAFGAARSLWASDFPWPARTPGYAATLAAVRQALEGWDEHDLGLVLGGTARTLFPERLVEEAA